MQLVGKYPILHLIIKQLKKSKLIDDIVLAISENPGNEIYVDFVRKRKLKYIVGNEEDVLKRLIRGAKHVKADVVLRINSENPYLFWEGIDPLIKNHLKGNYDFSTIANVPYGSGLELINLKSLEVSHKLGKMKRHREHCTLYINEHGRKFKICKFQIDKKLTRPELRLTVDNPQDLIVARIINAEIGNGDNPIPLKKIIIFLDNHPKIKDINSGIQTKYRVWLK